MCASWLQQYSSGMCGASRCTLHDQTIMRVWISPGAQIFLLGTAPTCSRTHTWRGPHTTGSGTNITSSRTHTWPVSHTTGSGTNITSSRTHTWRGPHTTGSGTNITSSRTHTPSHRGLITRWQNKRIVKLTAHLHLIPRLRIRGATTPLSCPSTLRSAKLKTETSPLPACSLYTAHLLGFPRLPRETDKLLSL